MAERGGTTPPRDDHSGPGHVVDIAGVAMVLPEPEKMTMPPEMVPWATVVEADELTAHTEFMPPFPSPDDPRFLEPPAIEWVPNPAYAAIIGAGAPSPPRPVSPPRLGFSNGSKSPPRRRADIVAPSPFQYDSRALVSPQLDNENSGRGYLAGEREVPHASVNETAPGIGERPRAPSLTGGGCVRLRDAEFDMTPIFEEAGGRPGNKVRSLLGLDLRGWNFCCCL